MLKICNFSFASGILLNFSCMKLPSCQNKQENTTCSFKWRLLIERNAVREGFNIHKFCLDSAKHFNTKALFPCLKNKPSKCYAAADFFKSEKNFSYSLRSGRKCIYSSCGLKATGETKRQQISLGNGKYCAFLKILKMLAITFAMPNKCYLPSVHPVV